METNNYLDLSEKKIWVAGHNGMAGRAIVRRLEREGCRILAADRSELDLMRQMDVENWVAKNQPDMVVIAAGKVGGIQANRTYPVDFLYNNIMISANIIKASAEVGVEKLLFLGSSCIYPNNCKQPMKEEYLMTGPLEPTNHWYSLAKISGIRLCQAFREQKGCNFISAMPTNLYGPNDYFHPENSHMPAALLSRFHQAKIENLDEVSVWGTGKPLREFLYVDDLADGCIYLLKNFSGYEHVNIGSGEEVSVAEFAFAVKEIVGYTGNIVFNHAYPDGMERKLLDCSNIHKLGWKHKTDLNTGLQKFYDWFLANFQALRYE